MTSKSNTKNYLCRAIGMAVLATALTAAPWPLQVNTASAQSTAPAAPAATDSTAKAKTKKPPSPGQVAMRERQKKCAAEWKQAKADGKLEKGMKWPKFWSACNKRLKGAS